MLLPFPVRRSGHSCWRGCASGKLGQHLRSRYGKCFSFRPRESTQGQCWPELCTGGGRHSYPRGTDGSGRVRHLPKATQVVWSRARWQSWSWSSWAGLLASGSVLWAKALEHTQQGPRLPLPSGQATPTAADSVWLQKCRSSVLFVIFGFRLKKWNSLELLDLQNFWGPYLSLGPPRSRPETAF